MVSPQAARICRMIFREIPLALAASLLITSVIINLVNVIGRYVFLYAIYWAEEAMIYMTIWSIFLAAIAIAYDRADLTMGLLFTKLSSPWKRIFEGVLAWVIVAVCLFMASQSLVITKTLIRNEQNSVALELPMWIPQSSLLFGFLMIAAAVAARFLLRLSDEQTPVPSDMAALT